MKLDQEIKKIEGALIEACNVVSQFTPGKIESTLKDGGDPVTEADLLLDQVLKEALLGSDEGWLSEETADDLSRLDKKRVWIVDPLDGTREFIQGIDEWSISVGLVEEGKPIAGGICNPMRNELFLGSIFDGITLNGNTVKVSEKTDLEGATVLASRSEVNRGEWVRFENAPFKIIPMGSVAYKIARVAAGLDDATFTLVPKNEWDVAGGIALILAGGGKALDKDFQMRVFNQEDPLLSGMICSNNEQFAKLLPYLK